MEGRYKKHGWFLEPERHSLASRGVKTSVKPIAMAGGRAVFGFIDTAREGLTQDIPQDDEQLIYEPVTVSGVEEEPDVMEDADSIIEAGSVEEIEPTEPVLTLPEEQTQPEYSSGVDREVSEIETAMSGRIIGSSWFDRAKNYVANKLKDLPISINENNPEKLSRNIGELDAHKELLNDKIRLIQETKNKVMSSKYREEVGAEKQIENAEKLNHHMQKLKGEISNIEYKVSAGKKHLQHIQSLPIEMTGRKKGEGFFSGIFPSFGELINPLSIADDKPKSTGRFRKSKVKEPYVSVFPNFDELLHPEKLRK